MERVESALSTAWYNNLSIQKRTSRAVSCSPLASARQAVSEALSEMGFIDIAANPRENFKVLVTRSAARSDRESPEPDRHTDLAASTADTIRDNPGRSEQVQAHIRPQDAVKLLK